MQGHQDGWVIVERVIKGKDKDIALPIKVYIIKAMVYAVAQSVEGLKKKN